MTRYIVCSRNADRLPSTLAHHWEEPWPPETQDPPETQTPPARGRAARIAAWPCSRRTKYLVLVFWILVVAVTGPLSSKLMGAEKNDASAYLPTSAESTQELNLQDKFVSKNLNPAVVASPPGAVSWAVAVLTEAAGGRLRTGEPPGGRVRRPRRRLPAPPGVPGGAVGLALRRAGQASFLVDPLHPLPARLL